MTNGQGKVTERKKGKRMVEEIKEEAGDDQPGGPSLMSRLLSVQCLTKMAIDTCFRPEYNICAPGAQEVERESMQNMAQALDSAQQVYGYRVDKVHQHAQDTRVVIVNGEDVKPSHDQGIEGLNDEAGTSEDAVPKKKRKVAADVHWENRYLDLLEDGLELEYNGLEEDEAFEEAPAEENDDELPITIDTDLDEYFKVAAERRERKALNDRPRGKMLVQEEESIQMQSEDLIENDYYQKAVSRQTERTTAAFLMNNVRTSGDARVFYLHERSCTTVVHPIDEEEVKDEFVKGIYDMADAALSKCAIDCETLIPIEEVDDTENIENENENTFLNGGNRTIMVDKTMMMTSPVPRAQSRLSCIVEESPSLCNEADECNGIRKHINHTAAVASALPPTASFVSSPDKPKSSRSAAVRTRAVRGDDIRKMWLPNSYTVSGHRGFTEFTELRTFLARKVEQLQENGSGTVELNEGMAAEEISMSVDELSAKCEHLMRAGLDEDLEDLDKVWNAVLVKKTVTLEEAEEQMKRAEEECANDHRLEIARKKAILRPGKYVFFMQPDTAPKMIAPDIWAEDQSVAIDAYTAETHTLDDVDMDGVDTDVGIDAMSMHDDVAVLDDVLDDLDPVGPLLDMFDASTNDGSASTSNDNGPAAQVDDQPDSIPDVPAAGNQIVVSIDPTILHLGKKDDAHWKGLKDKAVEAAKKKKDVVKKKKNNAPDERFLRVSTDAERAEYKTSFKQTDIRHLTKHHSELFMVRSKNRKSKLERPYVVTDFTRPALLYKGNYGGVRFERLRCAPLASAASERSQSSDTIDPRLGETEQQCHEWMKAFNGFHNISFSEPVDINDDSFHSVNDDFYDNNDDPINQSQLLANFTQNPENMDVIRDVRQNLNALRNGVFESARMHELSVLQGDDSDDEDAIDITEAGGRQYKLRYSRMDAVKMKKGLRRVLTNQLMSRSTLLHIAKDIGLSDRIRRSINAMEDDPHDIDSTIAAREVMATKEMSQDDDTSDGSESLIKRAKYNVSGLHSFTSVSACLPFQLGMRPGKTAQEKAAAASGFVAVLMSCNENNMELDQYIASQGGPFDMVCDPSNGWMGDFQIRDARESTN